jgi:hypothetical protein
MMNEMNITSAKYLEDDTGNIAIIATIDGSEWGVPMSEGNRHYAEIMRQVEAGTLTIQEAE